MDATHIWHFIQMLWCFQGGGDAPAPDSNIVWWGKNCMQSRWANWQEYTVIMRCRQFETPIELSRCPWRGSAFQLCFWCFCDKSLWTRVLLFVVASAILCWRLDPWLAYSVPLATCHHHESTQLSLWHGQWCSAYIEIQTALPPFLLPVTTELQHWN